MHDDAAEMTKAFQRDLEQDAEMLEQQRKVNAKLDVLIEALAATHNRRTSEQREANR